MSAPLSAVDMAPRQLSLQEPMFISTPSTELLVKPLHTKPDPMTLNCCFETLQATTGTKSEELVKLLPAKGSKKAYKNISNMARQGRRGSAGSLDNGGGGGW